MNMTILYLHKRQEMNMLHFHAPQWKTSCTDKEEEYQTDYLVDIQQCLPKLLRAPDLSKTLVLLLKSAMYPNSKGFLPGESFKQPSHEMQISMDPAYTKPKLPFIHSNILTEWSLNLSVLHMGENTENTSILPAFLEFIIDINICCDSLSPIRRQLLYSK